MLHCKELSSLLGTKLLVLPPVVLRKALTLQNFKRIACDRVRAFV